MSAIRVTLIFATITAVFLVPHFAAGLYAEPKPPATECVKPSPPPSS
jgi:hypothetical protein